MQPNSKNITFIFLLLTSFYALSAQPQGSPLRGVWLTNVNSRVLWSQAGIEEAVNICDSAGINTIFVVTLNKAMTTYPSSVMEKITGLKIDTAFTGRDPLKELITAAHKKHIKVIAWFEYGFASSYKADGGIIIKNRPNWASAGVDGKLVCKSGFEWMNGFNPEVQDFILSLMLEVIKNYDIDGVQGDDRMPAMPVEAGYDKYTVDLYKKEHGGAEPPSDIKDSAWVQWRADILTNFLKRLYAEVKKTNPNIIVSMAPSIYPWSKEEYLQDWPQWVRNKSADQIIPQLYRYNMDEYKKALYPIVEEQVDEKNLDKIFSGVLVNVRDYTASYDFLADMIKENRKAGIKGEVYFFYEGLKRQIGAIRRIYNK